MDESSSVCDRGSVCWQPEVATPLSHIPSADSWCGPPLQDRVVPPPEYFVMLGTPNQRSRMAEWVVRLAPWRWLAGEAGRKLADPDFYAELPGLSVPYTVIAGTRGLRFNWLPFGGRVNDGMVAVDETSVAPTDQVIEVAASHTFMMNRRRVRRAVLYALDSHVSA